ncbi:MAG: preprotein translocase subunit SecE [Oscillospiraceae bacterium]|nr:preprotein translocase subunit SecE [Oscillospiraceae bacterium]
MANDIEAKKNVGKSTPDEISDVKESADSKKSKDKDAKEKDKSKKASAKKPKKGIVKYFKDAKAEFKKVVWPTPKSTTNNTIVVIVVCLLAGLFIFGVDTLFAFLNKLILG